MPYTLYTTQEVFQQQIDNDIANAIMENLINTFTEPVVNAAFGLTGTVAKIMQGATNVEITVVAFITSSNTIFEHLKAQITAIIPITAYIIYPDRMQVITKSFYLEFWYKTPLTLTSVGGIFMELNTNINNYID